MQGQRHVVVLWATILSGCGNIELVQYSRCCFRCALMHSLSIFKAPGTFSPEYSFNQDRMLYESFNTLIKAEQYKEITNK